MKKFGNIVLASTALAFIVSCNGNKFAQETQEAQPTQQIKALSVQGAKDAYSTFVKNAFTNMDKNKDGSVTLAEYKTAFAPPAPTPPSPPAPNVPQEPVVDPQVAPPSEPNKTVENLVPETKPASSTGSVTASSATTSKPLTPEQIFKKIDKNNDGKINLTEAKESKFFIGYTQSDIRKIVNQYYYKNAFKFEKGRYSGTITYDEYMKIFNPPNEDVSKLLHNAFYSADRNFDEKLNFSEAEDLIYAVMKASSKTSPVIQPQPGPIVTSSPVNPQPGPIVTSSPISPQPGPIPQE